MDNLFGEFLGTAILIIFGCGVVANVCLKGSKGENSGWIVITAGWGFAVMLGVFTSTSLGAPQGDLNPAVTLAKTMNGVYTPAQAGATMVAQVLGAIVGAIVVYLAYLPHWEATEDKASKLGVFSTIPAIRSYASNFLCEAIGTFILILMIFAMFHANNGKFPAGVGPYLVGILIWALGLSLGGPTGYAINPARDLGPRIAHAILPIAGKGNSDWAYSWVPVLGPIVGGIAAYIFAKMVGIL
ncbi:MIP/aquaporin family protein [Pectinatus haikarae]|uniref:Glycerol uptake facilitator protein n=1 Tax=Pectinatus haikarae TaxID=349096 RepID=A0ABT9Y3G8_9FIRM|nr:MIP/aquaporin family protein [Pectinatus haikarae]MDQ0202369.1 glycerol uptake facilitator protein [Pectinatus haikarae]